MVPRLNRGTVETVNRTVSTVPRFTVGECPSPPSTRKTHEALDLRDAHLLQQGQVIASGTQETMDVGQ